tara:strand:+ start:6554 stop:7987 length:1434 start_codon:yes stop_codon:yes gene_type:complete
MTEVIHKIKRKSRFYKWWKWVALVLFLLLLFCFLFKCCDKDRRDFLAAPEQIIEGNTDVGYDYYPENPNRLNPIDTSMIEILPDDPLKREVVTNLINVYCHDTVELKRMAKEFIIEFPADSIKVSYYAEEYKRIQFQIPPSRRESLMDNLRLDVLDVKFVVDEWIISSSQTSSIPSDPGYSDSEKRWFYEDIGLFDAWKYGLGDPRITIAVIDDSFDPKHTELLGKFVKPWNVIDYNKNVNGDLKRFHGTHVAGTVGGNAENGFGISGVAPNCKIMPIQVADMSGNMTLTAILDGIFYALKNDVDVINMSLGQEFGHLAGLDITEQNRLARTINLDEAKMWDEVYKIAEEQGVIIVQAAGNSSVLASIDPMKRSKNSLIVGALDRSRKTANFSNVGEAVNVFAPGVEIYSSLPNNKMGPLQGTSMASPIVAGCVALIKSKKNDIGITELIQIIKDTGEPVPGEAGTLIRVDKILDII